MSSNNRSNALLVELLIVVIFFMLAATVLLQVFTASRNQTDRAELIANTLIDAQNIADTLYAADDPEKALADMGFSQNGDAWILSDDAILATVKLSADEHAGGVFWKQDLTITDDKGEILVHLPCSHYREVTP